MKVIVNVFLKEGILDPQGKATGHALEVMGFDGVNGVRIGKQILLDLSTSDETVAKAEAEKMAKALLVNEVIEEYTIEIGA